MFADHAFELGGADLIEEGLTLAGDVLAEFDFGVGIEEVAEAFFSFDEGFANKVLSVAEGKVEGEVVDVAFLPLDVVLEGVEIRDALIVKDDNFAIDPGVGAIEFLELLGDFGELGGPVEPTATDKGDDAVFDPGHDAVAVELDFVDPLVAGRGFFGESGELGGHGFGERIGLESGEDLLHGATGGDAGESVFGKVEIGVVELVLFFDHEPIFVGLAFSRFDFEEHPFALESVPAKHDFDIAFGEAFFEIADDGVGADIPEHHGAGSVFTFWDDAFECEVFDGVVFGLDSESFFGVVEAWPFGDGPAFEDAINF